MSPSGHSIVPAILYPHSHKCVKDICKFDSAFIDPVFGSKVKVFFGMSGPFVNLIGVGAVNVAKRAAHHTPPPTPLHHAAITSGAPLLPYLRGSFWRGQVLGLGRAGAAWWFS